MRHTPPYVLIFMSLIALLNTGHVSGACELYNIDFVTGLSTTSQYNVDCGEVSSSQWTVNNNKCVLTTSPIDLGGTTGDLVNTPLSVEVVTAASTTDCNDYVIIQYQIDDGSWVTQDSITSCEMSTSIFTYNFNVICGDTSAIKVRVIMSVYDDAGGAASEKLRIRDGGICVSSPVPMPVELVEMKAEQKEYQVRISWSTATETNNNYFMVEKSIDGNAFESFAFVKGNGNSSMLRQYTILDENPYYGITYYRVKQVDFGGRYQYSQIISNTYRQAEPATWEIVVPNPCNGTISVNASGCYDKEILVVLYDIMGKKIYSKVNLQENGTYFFTALDPDSKLQSGIYLVVGTSRNELINQKLLINQTSATECLFLLSCNQ